MKYNTIIYTILVFLVKTITKSKSVQKIMQDSIFISLPKRYSKISNSNFQIPF